MDTFTAASLALNVFQAVLLVFVVGYITAKPKPRASAPRKTQ